MDYALHIAILICIYAISASSLNLLVGYTGLLALSHAAFVGIGAYASALLGLNFGLGLGFGILGAAASAGVLALVLSFPLLRLHGDYFVLGSLGFQIIIHDVLYNWDAVTKGAWGLSGIPRPQVGPLAFMTHARILLVYLPIAVVGVGVVWLVSSSPFGRVLCAIREDEAAATCLGKNVVLTKTRIFVLASALGGVAGALYAHYITYIDPTNFALGESIYILSQVIVGGAGNVVGPMIGVLVLISVPEGLRFLDVPAAIAANIRQMLYAALMIAFLLFRPRGLAGKEVFG